jgi:tetratricopeptide (TPR) repeat protein
MASSNVRAWEEPVVIPTYPVPHPDRNPIFLDKRVYQGSSGKVYPNPFTDRVSDHKEDRTYRGVFLENEYVRLMMLPELGGRIHIGFDKTNGYDFFYRQNVIKPALVGLLGPWISGGVEFNWPQHHRPSTFMPVQHSIEEHTDGSCTVWLSEHEPMNRMKGMVGICLYPGKSLVEAKVRLYNRTPFVQTFLWWANAAMRVHDRYQAFFPPDVTFVADHAKRAISAYPIARDFYYGVDYRPGTDLSWYKNIPVPTSYMVTRSNYDFFGGYDHARRAGVVHVANRHIAPGKKMWTWGNADFGYAWERELTDGDGPYIELMAGVYTDNQPDFSWLQPYETRTFSQFWYPIQQIGPAKNANERVAINLEREGSQVTLGVCATQLSEDVRVLLTADGKVVFDRLVTLQPGAPFVDSLQSAAANLMMQVIDSQGSELIHYRPELPQAAALPSPAREPAAPADIATSEELYLAGLHLEQYRHATRRPESYWEEALRRDPGDSRCNQALGAKCLRRGEFARAEEHFRAAVTRLTALNPNPYDGECYFNLGLALRYQERLDEAYAAFYKATWNYAWRAQADYELALIDCVRGQYSHALAHLDNAGHANARNLKGAVLRRLGQPTEALQIAQQTLSDDPLDLWARFELDGSISPGTNPQTALDVAFDYLRAGMKEEAAKLLQLTGHANPIAQYQLAELGAPSAQVSLDYCFPSRLEEMQLLERAVTRNPTDACAHYLLGNLLYDKERREEAIAHWERACEFDPSFSIPWRNLGIGYFNVYRDSKRALDCYRSARRANPHDARLLYEQDQLQKRAGASPEARLAALEADIQLAGQRDDLMTEVLELYNLTGQSEKALAILAHRRFHPWEGGEGRVTGQYVMAHFLPARALLDSGQPKEALAHLNAAREYPRHLGEGKHLLTDESFLDYWTGEAESQLGDFDAAHQSWTRASHAPSAYYRGLALQRLGDHKAASAAFHELDEAAERKLTAPVVIDYFATSLPNFLLFDDDLEARNRAEALFWRALAQLGLDKREAALETLDEVLRIQNHHLWAKCERDACQRAMVKQ